MPFAERRVVSGVEDATELMLEELGERYGREFSVCGDLPILDNTVSGVRRVTPTISPSDDPGRAFSATLKFSAETGEVVSPVLSDWPQYLFRDRFLAPFAESLAGAGGLAGWGLTMTYVRYDSRAWRERDFDAYVGSGASGDPTAVAYVVLPAGTAPGDMAGPIADATIPLYALGRNLDVVVTTEGLSPRPGWMYLPDSSYTVASTRPGAPGLEDVRRGIEAAQDVLRAEGFPENGPWDGTASGGDPSLESYLPQVTWNPGHGPGA